MLLKNRSQTFPRFLPSGFTLIELIIVILIIGIVSVVAIPKWTASSQRLEFEVRRVLTDIRYAQALSMTSGERYRWVKLSSSSYQITNEAGTMFLGKRVADLTTYIATEATNAAQNYFDRRLSKG